jgi:lysophospholipase L1-like esterase
MKITNRIISKSTAHILFILCVALIAGCGGGGSSSGGSSDSGIPGLTKILIIADSIGTGAGVVASSSAFPELIRNAVSVPVVNNSVNSRQVAAGVSAARSLISSESPSHIIVLLGINDANNGNPSSAISGLRAIADLAQNAGVIALIGTIPRIPRDSSQNARAGEISSGIRGIGNARIVEIRNALAPSDVASDGFHPNASGQQLIADSFIRALFGRPCCRLKL